MRKVLLFALVLPLLASCIDDDYVDYAAIDEEIISEYLTENNIQAERDPSGLYYQILNEGIGDPIGDNTSQDDKVTFSFNSKTIDGKDFYKGEQNHTSYLSGLPYGFQIGLDKINRQGDIILYTPSLLCRDAYGYIYGEKNTVMIYRISVDRDQDDIDEDIIAAYLQENNITAERDESGLYYEILEEGEGENASENSMIDVTYKGTYLNGNVFDEGTLNNSKLTGLIEAWQIGIPKLNKGAKAKFYCPSQLCYGSNPSYDSDGKIVRPANSILIFELTLVEFI